MKGELIKDGTTAKKYGVGMMNFYKCITCGTSFPVIDGEIRCNGHSIELCPFCQEDSKLD